MSTSDDQGTGFIPKQGAIKFSDLNLVRQKVIGQEGSWHPNQQDTSLKRDIDGFYRSDAVFYPNRNRNYPDRPISFSDFRDSNVLTIWSITINPETTSTYNDNDDASMVINLDMSTVIADNNNSKFVNVYLNNSPITLNLTNSSNGVISIGPSSSNTITATLQPGRYNIIVEPAGASTKMAVRIPTLTVGYGGSATIIDYKIQQHK